MVETRKVLRRAALGHVEFSKEALPPRGPTDVLIRVRAVSLNWKDVALIDGRLPWPGITGGIVGTEFAGEVEWIGEKIRSLNAGDRVVSLINLEDITGRETTWQALGHNIDGTLAEYIVLPEDAVVKIPNHLAWVEASMISCAGLTAWSALKMTSRLCGKTVLIEGTGGVSILALTLAAKAGAKAIVTSSSDEKLQRARELGAWRTINYRRCPDWEIEILKLTDGRGVDLVVEQGGAATLLKSVTAVGKGGQVSQVGLLTTESQGDLGELVNMLIMKACSIVGIRVGIKSDLEEFVEFLSATELSLTPCIDRILQFDQAAEALDYLRSGKAFGKVVVEI
ncbi:GroES-like protein [Trichoderma velutinum]